MADNDMKNMTVSLRLFQTTVCRDSPDKKSVVTIPSAEKHGVTAAAGTSRCYSFASFSVHITSSLIGFLGNNSSIIKGKKKVKVELFPVLAQESFSFFPLLSSASHLFQWKQNFFKILLVLFFHLHTITIVFRAAIPVASL